MSKPIRPILADVPILSPETRALINPLFDDEDIGLLAVLVGHYADRSELVATAPNNYFFRDENDHPSMRTWGSLSFVDDTQCAFASAMMTLSEEMDLADHIRDIGLDYGSLPQHNYFTATIMRHCVILSHGDLESYVAESLHCLHSEFEAVDTRASICTVVVPPLSSNHAKIGQLDKVKSDVECFRKIHANFFDSLNADHGFDLGDFSKDDRDAFLATR